MSAAKTLSNKGNGESVLVARVLLTVALPSATKAVTAVAL